MQLSASKNIATPTRRSGRLLSLIKSKPSNQSPPEIINMIGDDTDDDELPKGVSKPDEYRSAIPKKRGKARCADSKYEHGECSDAWKGMQADKRTQIGVGKRKKVMEGGNYSTGVAGNANLAGNVVKRHHRLRIRSPPICLYLIVKKLNDEQKQAVRDLGFGPMIDFNISEIPTILGQMAMDAFDHTNCTLNVKGDIVNITKEKIHEYLGVSMTGERINALKSAKVQDVVTKEWRSQFNKENKRISTCNVYDEMMKHNAGGRMFKLNFLVMYVTIMAEGNMCSTVNQKFLPSMYDLDKVKDMDWCGYIFECLKRTKQEWDRSKHYNGPLVFLVVLFANTLKPKRGSSNMGIPVMNMWSADDLVEMQKYLIKLDGGGTDDNEKQDQMAITGDDNVMVADMNEHASDKKSTKRERLSEGVNGQDTSGGQAPTMETSVEECKRWLSKLFEKIENDVTEANKVINVMVHKTPDDSDLQNMALLRDKLMMAYKVEVNEGSEKDAATNKKAKPDVGIDMMLETQFFNSPTVMKSVELSEMRNVNGSVMLENNVRALKNRELGDQLPSPNWDLKITQQMENTYCEDELHIRRLSFGDVNVNSLKVVDLRKDQGGNEVGDNEKGEEAVQRKGEEGVRENNVQRTSKVIVNVGKSKDDSNKGIPYGRSQRERRVPDILLSPYLQREVRVGDKLCVDEQKTSACVFAATRSPSDILFRTRTLSASRLVFESMLPGVPVDPMAIDAWSVVLNYEERLRNPKTFGRLFYKTEMVTNEMMNNSNDYRKHSEHFGREMDEVLKNSIFKSLSEVELVFFPLIQEDNWYVICFNMKKPCLHVIDSYKRKEANLLKVYGEIPLYLVRLFTDFLITSNHPGAISMTDPRSRIIKIKSQTESNMVDSGVFVMRHMEVYKGKSDVFDDGLEVEGPRQKAQLNDLRVKYLTKMLTSVVNNNKPKVERDVEDYGNMALDNKRKWKVNAIDRVNKRLVRMK